MRVDERDLFARARSRASQASTTCSRIPAAVELLRRRSIRSSGSRRRRRTAGTCCSTRRRSRPTNRLDLAPVHAGFRRAVVLQAVRLPDRRRLPAGPEDRARQTAASVVFGRHHHGRVGAGRQALSGRQANRRSKTARSTTWRSRPSRSGCEHIESIGIDTIHERVRCLTGWLLDQLLALRQTNGEPLVRLYGPPNDRPPRRHRHVQFLRRRRPRHRSPHRRSSTPTPRTSRCAPGASAIPAAGEIALGLTGTELSSCFRQPEHQTHMTVDDFKLCIDGKSTGAVRVSLGMVSNDADVDRFIAFAKEFIGQ